MRDDDDILDIDSADLAEEPLPPVLPDGAAALDVSLDDLPAEAAEAFPAVTDDQLLAAANSITIRTLCSTTGQAFAVRYVEDKPGVFVTQQATLEAEGGEAGASPYAPTAPTGQVEGTFEVSPDYACPGCGSTAVLVCGKCGVDLCAGSAKAHAIICPRCHSQIQIGGKATSATGLVGKGKGKAKA